MSGLFLPVQTFTLPVGTDNLASGFQVPPMNPRFAIVDSHAAFRALVRHHLGVRWPEARVDEFDPSKADIPATDLAGAGYDLVLVDPTSIAAASTQESLNWMKSFCGRSDSPPIIVLPEGGDELYAVRAMKAGVADYIPKRLMTHQLLVRSVDELLVTRDPAALEAATTITDSSMPRAVVLPGYRIVRPISQGRLASVYLADSKALGERVVLKVLMDASDMPGFREDFDRFTLECDLVGQLNNRAIVDIYDHGISDYFAFIAMEYFPCGDFKARLQNPLSGAEIVDYMSQLAAALQVIHELGVLHRDLKPGNVMLREDNSIALIDFGLAKQLNAESGLTGAGEIRGTPYYLSPEQAKGESVDTRSDLYSLGVMLYEMLTGKKPFVGNSSIDIIHAHVTEDIPELPPERSGFQGILEDLMAKNPDKRIQSAGELLNVLEDFDLY